MNKDQIQEFLETVWPDDGLYCVAALGSNGRFNNFHASSPEYAANLIVSNPYAGDWYYALASFKNPLNPNAGFRKQDNAAYIRVLAFDIDCGPDKYAKNPQGAYPTLQDGFAALNNFINITQMPVPTIVLSGMGLHTYWVFENQVTVEEWQPVADKLKAVARALDFRIDAKVTADSARVLRPVGSLHRKSGSLVAYHHEAPDVVFTEVAARIEKAAQIANAVVLTKPKGKPVISGQFLDPLTAAISNTDGPPPDGTGAMRNCKQLNKLLDPNHRAPYPQWFHGLQVIRFFSNGKSKAHQISEIDPRYTFEETERRLNELEAGDIKPTFCATFESQSPGYCDKCEHRGRISTPLTLAREWDAEQAKREQLQQMGADEQTLDEHKLPKEMPEGYAMGSADDGGGVIMSLETGKGGVIKISPYWAFVHDTLKDMHGNFTALVRFLDPRYGWKDVQVPFETLASEPRQAAGILASQGLIVEDESKRGHLMTYLTRFAQQIRQAKDSVQTYDNYGWIADCEGFVMGDKVYRPNQKPEQLIARGPLAETAAAFQPAGTLEAWRGLTDLYRADGYENHRIAVLLAPAAMLFEFTGMDSALVSFYGEGGEGKTSSLAIAAAFFGRPASVTSQMNDTEGAIMAKMGLFGSLLLPYDEMTKDDPEVLRQFILTITKGKDKSRLIRGAGGKYHADMNVNEWRTIVACTTNRSVIQTIESMKGAQKAEASRVLELRYRSAVEKRNDFRDMLDYTLAGNYGQAAPIFVQYIVDNMGKVRDKVRELRTAAADQLKDLPVGRDRYYISLVAAVTTAAILCKKLGLLNYDPAWAFQYLIDAIRTQNSLTKIETAEAWHNVANFYFDNVDKFLILRETPNGVHHLAQPRGQLIGRIHQNEGKWLMRVRVDSFRAYCQEKGINERDLLAALERDHIYMPEESNKTVRLANAEEAGKDKAFMNPTRVRVFRMPALNSGDV